MSAVISEDGSVVISSGAEDTADDEGASGSSDGGAVGWTFVDDAGGEEGWSAVSVVSLHPAREIQRIRCILWCGNTANPADGKPSVR